MTNPFLQPICFECISKFALNIGLLTNDSVEEAIRLAAELMGRYSDAIRTRMDDYVELCTAIFDITHSTLGDADPFAKIKEESMKVAKSLLPVAEGYVHGGGDEFERAVKVAVAANMLDFGTGVYNASLEAFRERFMAVVEQPLVLNHTSQLRQMLDDAGRVLYVLDNAGECVLDAPLVRLLAEKAEVVVAARGGPVMNDATLEEARAAGLDRYAELISTGARVPGVNVRRCSREFVEALSSADVAVLKGQGNFQSFYEVLKVRRGPTFYLLTPKCKPVADYLGVGVGSLVSYRYR